MTNKSGIIRSQDGLHEVWFMGRYIGTTRTMIEAMTLLKRLKDLGPESLNRLPAVLNSIRIAA